MGEIKKKFGITLLHNLSFSLHFEVFRKCKLRETKRNCRRSPKVDEKSRCQSPEEGGDGDGSRHHQVLGVGVVQLMVYVNKNCRNTKRICRKSMTMLTSLDVSHVTFYPEILQVTKVPKAMKKVDADHLS